MENNNKIEIYIKGLMVVHGFITKPSQNSWFLSQKQIDTTTRLKTTQLLHQLITNNNHTNKQQNLNQTKLLCKPSQAWQVMSRAQALRI